MGAEIIGGINLNQASRAIHKYDLSPDTGQLFGDIFALSKYAGAPPIINGTFSLVEGMGKIIKTTKTIPINSTYPTELDPTTDLDSAFIWDGAWTLTFAINIEIGGTIGTAETITLYGVTGTYFSNTTEVLKTFTAPGSYAFNMAKIVKYSIPSQYDAWNVLMPLVKVSSSLSTSKATATAEVLSLVLINSKEA